MARHPASKDLASFSVTFNGTTVTVTPENIAELYPQLETELGFPKSVVRVESVSPVEHRVSAHTYGMKGTWYGYYYNPDKQDELTRELMCKAARFYARRKNEGNLDAFAMEEKEAPLLQPVGDAPLIQVSGKTYNRGKPVTILGRTFYHAVDVENDEAFLCMDDDGNALPIDSASLGDISALNLVFYDSLFLLNQDGSLDEDVVQEIKEAFQKIDGLKRP